MPTTSSSDDSEDETVMRRLREATDQTLLTNSMFTGETTKSEDVQTTKLAGPSHPARKSQRYIEVDERLTNDMQVTESMQIYMHKKLNQILEKRIEFVEIASSVEEVPSEDNTSMVRLFRDSAPIVLDAEPSNTGTEAHVKQKRLKKRKRRLAIEDDDQNEADKLAASVVSKEDIQQEVSTWKEKSKPHKHFEYVAHKITKQLHLKEPDNEFTQMRKKNNWSENKIARK